MAKYMILVIWFVTLKLLMVIQQWLKNYVEIYDNRGDFKEKVKNGLTYNKDLDDNKKVKTYANKLIEYYKKQYKDYNISLDSTLKVYDDKKEKVVVHINIKIVSKNTKATSIATKIME